MILKWNRLAMAAAAASLLLTWAAIGHAADSGVVTAHRCQASISTAATNDQGVLRVHESCTPAQPPANGRNLAIAKNKSMNAKGTAAVAPRNSADGALWTYDDEVAIPLSIAIDNATVWTAWSYNNQRLTAHSTAGDGTPTFEYSSGLTQGPTQVASANDADRAVFVETGLDTSNSQIDQVGYSFNSNSDGIPDWEYQFPTYSETSTPPVVVSRNGSTAVATLASSAGSTLYVFDALTGGMTTSWNISGLLTSADLTDDGSIVLVRHNSLITLFGTATGNTVFEMDDSISGGVYHISGNGNVFLVNGEAVQVYAFDGTTYNQVINFARPNYFFDSAATVSRDGSTVGVFGVDYSGGPAGTNGEIYLFDVATGSLLGSQALVGSGVLQAPGSDAASSDDGTVVAFSSWGTQFHDWPEVMIFNRDVEMIGAMHFQGSAFSVDVSADGRYVAGSAKAVHSNYPGAGGNVELIELTPGGNPIPIINALDPSTAAVDSSGVTLTVNGNGFRPGSIVRFAGQDRATIFVDTKTLQAEITAADLINDGHFPITVFTTGPGGGESLPKRLDVLGPLPPNIDTDLQELSSTLEPGQTQTRHLSLSNSGEHILNWNVTQVGRAVQIGSNLARGDVNCDGESGSIVHDDGTVDSGYSAEAGSVVFVDRFSPSAYPASISSVCIAFAADEPTSLDFEIVVFDDDGLDGGPGTELGSLPASADVPEVPTLQWLTYDVSSIVRPIGSGSVFIGVRWVPSTPNIYILADASMGHPIGFAGGYWWNEIDNAWAPTQYAFPSYRSLFVRAVEQIGDCTVPAWIDVSPSEGSVDVGASQQVGVTFDAASVSPGRYSANLCIASNDPADPMIVVPLSLDVTASQDTIFSNGFEESP